MASFEGNLNVGRTRVEGVLLVGRARLFMRHLDNIEALADMVVLCDGDVRPQTLSDPEPPTHHKLVVGIGFGRHERHGRLDARTILQVGLHGVPGGFGVHRDVAAGGLG